MKYNIAPAQYIDTIEKRNGKTKDIINAILDANNEPLEKQTFEFSKQFERSKQGLKSLWEFVKYNIKYLEDPQGVQWIKEPSRLWADRIGDCKSFTIFICSVLKNLKIDYTIRFVTYSPNNQYVTHVYPIAHLDGNDIILDAVWHRFNAQKEPYYLTKDYFFNMEISRLSGIGDTNETLQRLINMGNHMHDVVKHLNTGSIDITKMTEREAIAYFSGGRVQGIGSNAPAVVFPQIYIDAANVNGFFQDVGNWVQRNVFDPINNTVNSATDWVKKQLSSLVNWLVNTGLRPCCDYFWYCFIVHENIAPPEMVAKKRKQMNVLNWISRLTGVSIDVLLASLKKFIYDKHGRDITVILLELSGKGIGNVGATDPATIQAIISAVSSVINTIVSFFKKDKSEAPPVNANDAPSDKDAFIPPPVVPTVLPKEPTKDGENPNPGSKPNPGSNPNPAGTPPKKDDNTMLLLAGGAALFLLMKK